jgi:hypothetical protein
MRNGKRNLTARLTRTLRHEAAQRRLPRTLECMPDFVEHPATLVIIVIACSPLLFPLARFFFDDIETFKAGNCASRPRASPELLLYW